MDYRPKDSAFNRAAILSVTDTNGIIRYANENFSKLTGYPIEELIGQSHKICNSGFHSQEFWKSFWKTLQSGNTWCGQIKNKNKSGKHYWHQVTVMPLLNEDGVPEQFLSLHFDITEHKELEAAMQSERARAAHSLRLSALGEMSGSIAHEINNPLAIILGKIEAIRMGIVSNNISSEKILTELEKLEKTALRIVKVIHGLKEFSRSNENVAMVPSLLSAIIKQTLDLCQERIRLAGIDLRENIPEITIPCRPAQISQILMNLLLNSIDALEMMPEKWIEISAKLTGDWVEIAITDSGNGIPEDIHHRLVEPFFTTKPVGKGTGLGLSITKGIVDDHGGRFLLDSACKNTRFIIYLPLKADAIWQALDVDDAIAGHLNWRQNIVKYLAAPDGRILAAKVAADDLCSLGLWIKKNEKNFVDDKPFLELKSIHSQMHLCGGELIARANKGELVASAATQESGSQLDDYSKKVVKLLTDLKKAKN